MSNNSTRTSTRRITKNDIELAMSACDVNYPLRVGVTGHRSIPDHDAVAKAVERVLQYVEDTLRHAADRSGQDRKPITRLYDTIALTALRPLLLLFGLPKAKGKADHTVQTQVHWTVVSPLAKGADRIVAKAVLSRPGAQLRAVTPFALDEYRKDFHGANDREEFEGLLQLDNEPTVLHTASEVDWSNQQHRNQAYFDTGRYVVDSCELIIAIWDGKPAAGFGGTGDVVRHAIKGGKRVIWIDSNESNRPACMIVPDPEGREPFAGARVARLPNLAKQLSLGYHRLAAYNRDPIVSETLLAQQIDREVSRFAEVASKSGLQAEATRQITQQLLPLYVRADLAAVAYQKLYQFGAKALFRFSAFAVSIAVLQILFFPSHTWIVALEVLAMLMAVLLYRVSFVEAWHEKWLNDRHLAEWLRSAMFTSLMGQRQEHRSNALSLPFYEGPDQWFVESFQRPIDRVRKEMPSIEFDALKKLLVDEWIEGQARWHATNSTRKHQAGHTYHRVSAACFWVTLVMAALHMLGVGHEDHTAHQVNATAAEHANASKSHHGEDDSHHADTTAESHQAYNRLADVSLWISFLAVILPAWGAATHGIASLFEFDRLAARSHKMSEQLTKVAQHAAQAMNHHDLVAEIEKAETVMAAENQEWFASLMFRKLEVVA